MFLTGGGVYRHVDPRRTSVAAALDFAAGAGLEGVVLNTLALQREAGWVEAAREKGLRVMTYGKHERLCGAVLARHCERVSMLNRCVHVGGRVYSFRGCHLPSRRLVLAWPGMLCRPGKR
jgi:hypothetical protein